MNTPALPQNYTDTLNEIVDFIADAQVKVIQQVNHHLILRNWDIGNTIVREQNAQGWGAKVLDQLASDLSIQYPNQKGFSRANLMNMRRFAEAWPDRAIVQQAVGQLAWGHNITILEKTKDQDERLFYIETAIKNGWSRSVLKLQIEQQLYQRSGTKVDNFKATLPAKDSDLVREQFKDSYLLDFLHLSEDAQEKELEDRLIKHMQKFLLALGTGFAFVGQQVNFNIEGNDFFIDLLFYHLKLRRYVVIDLKIGEFKAEYTGKQNLYLSIVDDHLRNPEHDEPSIGIILCSSRNDTIAEYSLRGMEQPIGIATWQQVLPDKSILERELAKVQKEIVDLKNQLSDSEAEPATETE